MQEESPAGQSRYARIHGSIEKAANAAAFFLALAGIIWIVILMLVMNYDILGRYLFNAPLAGTPEFVGLSVSSIVFLLLPQTVIAGRIIQVMLTVELLAIHAPRFGMLLQRLICAISALVMGGIAYWLIPRIRQTYNRSSFIGTEGIFTFPQWPLYSIIMIGCVTACICYLLLATAPGKSGRMAEAEDSSHV